MGASLFRSIILLALSVQVFYWYCLARTLHNSEGVSVGRVFLGAGLGLAMLVPLVWVVWLPDLTEIYTRHIRARRWWKKNRCPTCGYQRAEGVGKHCPECGSRYAEPPPYEITRQTVLRYGILNLLAWLIGCTVGEAWLLATNV